MTYPRTRSAHHVARKSRAGALALALVGGCGQDDPAPVTQVVVTVSAEAELLAQLTRIEARVYRTEAVYDPQPVATHVFERPAAGPLSFGVMHGDARRFLLVLEGHGPEGDGEKVLIERKLVAEFTEARTAQLDVQLASACLRLPSPCTELTHTCHAGARACAPVEQARTRALEGGALLPPEVAAREPVSDACRDRSCPFEYPCTPTPGGGHVCLGQFADWPMPDASPGALHPPRYDLRTEGIARDEVTGLSWQRQAPEKFEGCTGRSLRGGEAGTACTWDEAKLYCHNLTLGGMKWRLPSRIELTSIVDPRERPAIPAATFTGCGSFGWTSSLATSSTTSDLQMAWVILSTTGFSGFLNVTERHCVRCVSGVPATAASADARYAVDGETIRDAFTGLRWQRTLSQPLATAAEASAYCSDRGADFRLPTIKELLTLVDPTRSPTIDPVFADQEFSHVWAAPGSTSEAFGTSVNFTTGVTQTERTGPFDRAAPRVRCVR